MNLVQLNDKTALVCGATQGIGYATANVLASQGAKIVAMARNEQALQNLLTELPNTEKHTYLVADFSNPQQVQQVLENYLQQNVIHIVVNNTGGPAAGPIAQAQSSEFVAAFSQHLLCNHLIAQAVLPQMKEQRFGRFINIISTSVKQPLKNLGVSNTIRAAVANWAKTLATEVAPWGITVNNVLPGATATQRLSSIIENKATKTQHSQEVVTQEMLAEIPMGRFAQAEEIAYAVAFLASNMASYITGINIPVDGGRTACL